MSAIVEVQDLYKQYSPPDGVVAVKNVSFDIQEGEIFSLLGPNGAGKTTIISIISCLLAPTRGDAVVDGHSVVNEAKEVKKVIGVVPQEIALYNRITARDNLVFWGKMHGLSGQLLKERVTTALEVAGLTDRANDQVVTFSGGMKRRLNIAVGLLHNPKILFMDEPTVGIDPQSRRRILDTVKELNQQGLAVLYTTHYMEEAQELSQRIGIIDGGELIALGTLDELTKTVGQFDTIRIQLGTDLQYNGQLIESISKLPNIHQAIREEEELIIQVPNANEALPKLVQAIANDGGEVKQMEVREPNLEAVFLHLTGRALRD